MANRRQFLQHSALGMMAFPAFGFIPSSKKTWSLESLLETEPGSPEYWRAVRLQFPLKEGQTYFNNGTMGPTPGYVIDKIIQHMMYWGEAWC